MTGITLEVFDEADPPDGSAPALVDVVDRLLARGVVLRGELWLSVADVDLVFVGLHVVLSAPCTVRRGEGPSVTVR
ncbi:MAG: gas vesicle protein [Pseudomonadota bacterium]